MAAAVQDYGMNRIATSLVLFDHCANSRGDHASAIACVCEEFARRRCSSDPCGASSYCCVAAAVWKRGMTRSAMNLVVLRCVSWYVGLMAIPVPSPRLGCPPGSLSMQRTVLGPCAVLPTPPLSAFRCAFEYLAERKNNVTGTRCL